VLTVWVVAECLHREATQKLQQFGILTRTKSGEVMQNPYLPVINKQAQLMLKAAEQLGFTPASRTRVEAGGGKAPAGRFDGLMTPRRFPSWRLRFRPCLPPVNAMRGNMLE
jgi:P27 family predicted phage terminase small subunit